MFKNLSTAMLALILGAGSSAAAELRDGKILIYEQFKGTVLSFEAESWPPEALGVTISVEGPMLGPRKESYTAMAESGKEVPKIDLLKFGELTDGVYVYEITGSTGERVRREMKLNNGRKEDPGFDLVSFSLGGQFLVDGRQIIVFEQGEEKGSDKPTDGGPGDKGDDGDVKFKPVIDRTEEVKDSDEAGDEGGDPDKPRDDG